MRALASLTSSGVPDATDEESMFLEVVSEFVGAEVETRAQEIEETGEVPADLVSLMVAQELAAIAVPSAAGGSGGRSLLATLAIEKIAESSAAVGMELGLRQAGMMAVAARDDAEPQVDGMVPPLLVDATATATFVDGQLRGFAAAGFGIEPGADIVVLASGDAGAAAAILISVGADIEPYQRTGLKGLSCARLGFEDSAGGVDLGAHAVEAGRMTRDLAVGACAVGVGRRAVRTAAEYLQERRQFGRSLAQFGALRRILADSTDRAAAAASLLHLASSAATAELASQAARLAVEAAVAISDDSLQLHGGYGYINEYLPERLLRDAVTLRAIAATRPAAHSAEVLLAAYDLSTV